MTKSNVRVFGCVVLTATILCVNAQVITTVAGTDFTFPDTPLIGTNAPIAPVCPPTFLTLAILCSVEYNAVAIDSSGNLYIADSGNNLVFKVNQRGVLTQVAGNGTLGFSGDGGPANSSALGPAGVAVDAAGNLFIADTNNNRIRKVTPDGIISTVAGTERSDSLATAVQPPTRL